MTARDDKKVALPEPVASAYRRCMRHESRSNWVVYPGKAEDDKDWVNLYTADQLESYAVSRVAEATEELQRRIAELEANDRRYRWLRKNCTSGRMEDASGLFELNCDEPESEWDAAIDAILADREGGKA